MGKEGRGEVKLLPLLMQDIERFRYRVEDVARGVTKNAVNGLRARDLQLEALHSSKLKAHFEDHPDDLAALQKAQRSLKDRKSTRQHLKVLPGYLVPEQLGELANPV